MLAVLAEFERDQISERTRGALVHLRNQGKRVSGRAPYGYTLTPDGRHVIPDSREQTNLQTIHSLADGRSLRSLSRDLARRGIVSRSGKPFHHDTLRGILERDGGNRPVTDKYQEVS